MADPHVLNTRSRTGSSSSPRTSSPMSKKCSVEACLSPNIKPLKCYECAAEYHSACINIKPSVFKLISESAKSGVRWHCHKCLESPAPQPAVTLLKNFDDFKTSMKAGLQAVKLDVESQLTKFKESILASQEAYQNTSSKVSDSIVSYASALKANISQQSKTVEVVNELKQGVQELSNKAEIDKKTKSEAEIRNFKRNNIMLFRLPESTNASPEKAYEEDFINTMNVIDPDKKLQNTDVLKLYRVGGKDSPRPRPVIIRFQSLEKRNEILKMNRLFHNSAGQEKVQVYIAPDRTKQEREDHKKLVDELKKRKSDGEEDITIQNGKIVHIQSLRFSPKSFFKLRNNQKEHGESPAKVVQ